MYESYQSLHTELSRFSADLPTNVNIKIGGRDIGETMNTMSEITNQNIDLLETSIRHSAKLTFWLNLLSCIMALVGFVSQVSDHREKDKKDREKYP